MSFCPNCGQQIGPNETFCPNCGTKVEPDAAASAAPAGQPQAAPPHQVPPQPQARAQYQAPPQPQAGPQYQAPPQPQARPQYQAPPQHQAKPQYQAPPQPQAAPQYQTPPQYRAQGPVPPASSASDNSKNVIIGVLAAIIIIGGGLGYYLHSKGSTTPPAPNPAPQTATTTKPAAGAAAKPSAGTAAKPAPAGEIKPADNRRMGTITGNEVMVRTGSSTSAAQITDLDQGTQVEILETRKSTDRRAAVVTTDLSGSYNGQPIRINKGYGVIILRDNGNGSSRCQLTVDNHDVYMQINNNNLSSIYGQTWYKVKLDSGQVGWVFGDFVQPN